MHYPGMTRLERHTPPDSEWIRSVVWWAIVPLWVSQLRKKLMDMVERTTAFSA